MAITFKLGRESHLFDHAYNFGTLPGFNRCGSPDLLLAEFGGCTAAEQAGILQLRAKRLTDGNRSQESIEGN
ncbi:hypothetical protein H6F67_00265 [Microcoleus sp. FACHB-1515]|uniref:hypothetical protein n=1 Tax=Leptolyngbya sp. FACHB-1515 TaxID=2933931 RepID=UPI00198DFA38|nr:hypothetical protein [Microcoleus sp. FACHB-1515]